MELKRYKLGELLDVKRGASLAGEYYATEGEYVRLTCGNFDYVNNCFKENTSKDNLFYTGKVRKEFIMQKGDIITPLTEQAIGLLGSTAIIPESNKYIQSQDVAKIICKEELLYPMYAFYLISSASVKAQLGAAAQQTKIRHTSPDKIKDCVVWIPDLADQRRIASVLSNIDKKIALNRQINANLEALSKQLYDYWFVQFEFPDANGKPYKSSGGKMVYNEKLKREIPDGWEVKKLGKIVDLQDSKRIPLSTYQRESRKGIYPYYGATGIMDYIDDYIFDEEIILLAEDGSTSDNNGNPIVQYVWGKVWVNNHAHIILPKNKRHKIFSYFMLKTIPVKLIETGSIQKKINQENLLGYQICEVPEKLLEQFTDIVSPIWRKKMRTTEEITSLTKQRDELLPLLMNGQVKVE